MHALTFAADTSFPTHHPILTLLLHLTGGRGSGVVSIVGIHADSEQVVFTTPQRTIQFPGDPLAVHGLVFRILDVPVPAPGLYYIQFQYDKGRMTTRTWPSLAGHATSTNRIT